MEKNPYVQREALRKVLHRLKKYRVLIVLSILFAAVTVALTLYVPVLVGDAIDRILGAGQVDFAGIASILLQIGILVAVTSLLQWLMNTINNKITFQVVRDVRSEAFRKIQILPLKYLDAHSHGEIVSRVIADVDQFADGLLLGFTQLFTGVLTILGTLGFMLSIHAGITLHLVLQYGENDHHKAEALFKAAAHALRAAVRQEGEGVLSTKGVL